MALATVQDFEEITGQVVTGSPAETQVARLLEVASQSLLLAANGQELVEGTDTVTLRPVNGRIRLPQRPVTAVASVVADGRTLTVNVDYRWTEDGRIIRLDQAGDDACWDAYVDRWGYPVTNANRLTVNYTHGLNPFPEPLIAALVGMAAAGRGAPDRDGKTSESIGGYSVSYDTTGTVAHISVPGYVRSLLDEYLVFPEITSVVTVAR